MATVIKIKTGTATPTTSDITDREVAIDKTAQKFYINDGGTIKEIAGAAAQGNAFANIAVSGQVTVEADTTTDTLTIVGTGLNSISTDASNDSITIGTSRGINFTKRDGTATFIDPSSNATTLGTTINTFKWFVDNASGVKTELSSSGNTTVNGLTSLYAGMMKAVFKFVFPFFVV